MIDEGKFQIPSVLGSFRPGGKAGASQSSARGEEWAESGGPRLGSKIGAWQDGSPGFRSCNSGAPAASQGYCRAVARNLNSQSQHWQMEVIMICRVKILFNLKNRTPDLQCEGEGMSLLLEFTRIDSGCCNLRVYGLKYVGFG